jgi:hypothetical protein
MGQTVVLTVRVLAVRAPGQHMAFRLVQQPLLACAIIWFCFEFRAQVEDKRMRAPRGEILTSSNL